MPGRRKIEVAAEGTLLATYKVKDAMAYIRNPAALGGSTRTRQPGETETVASLRDTYFVPLERMQKTSADFAGFEKMQFLCQVVADIEAMCRPHLKL